MTGFDVSRGKIDFGLVVSCLLHIYNFTECGSMRVWILSSLRLESYQKKKYSCHQQLCTVSFILMRWCLNMKTGNASRNLKGLNWSSLGMKNYYFKFSFSRFFLQSKDMEIFCTIITAMVHIFFLFRLYTQWSIFFS